MAPLRPPAHALGKRGVSLSCLALLICAGAVLITALTIVRGLPGTVAAPHAAPRQGSTGELLHASSIQDVAFPVAQRPDLTFEQLRRTHACAARPQRALDGAADAPMPQSAKALFVIGAQKAGTTWLSDVLWRHEAFVPARKDRGNGKAFKEPHFFDTWPLPPFARYQELYRLHRRVPGPNKAILDVTPAYLPEAWAPPLIQALVPHARFVVLLRDPTQRSLSAHRMAEGRGGPFGNCFAAKRGMPWTRLPGNRCQPRFGEAIDLTLAGNTTCLFQRPAGNATWHDCHRCAHKRGDTEQCSVLVDSTALRRKCARSAPLYDPIQISLYAAQLAWWLRFFPADRFLVLPTASLRHPQKSVKYLNLIREHAGLHNARNFTRRHIKDVEGYTNPNSLSKQAPSRAERRRLAQLRRFFDKPQADLHALLRNYELDGMMDGLDHFLN